MKLSRRILALVFLAVTPGNAFAAGSIEYRGLCEASAVAFIDATHFAMASDETNTLQLYEFGKPDPLGEGVDFEDFTGFDKSDLEGAAAIGNRIYWISSHSFNSDGEDKKKRKVLFATEVVEGTDGPTLKGVGEASITLRDRLVEAASVAKKELNIEGLAATPDGGLLIGLRAPLQNNKALVIRLENPAAVIDNAEAPKFGAPMEIKLDGMGIRSLEQVGMGDRAYLISAGPVSDSTEGIALYWWSGSGDPVKVENFGFGEHPNFKPEAIAVVPGTQTIAIFSDDGKKNVCEDEDDKTPKEDRKFRGIVFDMGAN